MITDFNFKRPGLTWCIPCLTIVRGDSASVAIAASSIRVTTASKSLTTDTITPSRLSSFGCQKKALAPVEVTVHPTTSSIPQARSLHIPNRRASLHSIPTSCPAHSTLKAHPPNSVTKNSLSNSNGSSLRPCLRHRRNLSHSCDDLLNSSRKVAEAVAAARGNNLESRSNANVSSTSSVCNGSVKSVKFLLPDKKSSNGDDHNQRRFSIGSLVPGAFSNYTWTGGIPYFSKNWPGFQGSPFLFGPNVERYLWSNYCCPCYQCQVPFSYAAYNIGHWQYSLATAKHRQMSIATSSSNQAAKIIHYQSASSSEEGSATR